MMVKNGFQFDLNTAGETEESTYRKRLDQSQNQLYKQSTKRLGDYEQSQSPSKDPSMLNQSDKKQTEKDFKKNLVRIRQRPETRNFRKHQGLFNNLKLKINRNISSMAED